MATIIVETGAIITGANSYVSTTDLATYATDRGVTIAGTQADLLIQAMDYIESKDFIGDKQTLAQSLLWPRYNVEIDSFVIDSDTIPQLLIDALCEVAISIDGGTNPMANLGRETRMEKVDVLEVEYATGASNRTYLTAAETKLNKLVKNNSGRAIRG